MIQSMTLMSAKHELKTRLDHSSGCVPSQQIKIWIGTKGGVYDSYVGQTRTKTRLDHSSGCVPSQQIKIWIGTKGGYDSYVGQTRTKNQTGSQFWLCSIATDIVYLSKSWKSQANLNWNKKQSQTKNNNTRWPTSVEQLNTHSRSRTCYLWLLSPLYRWAMWVYVLFIIGSPPDPPP